MPAGLDPGKWDVSVLNPDGELAALHSGFTVFIPMDEVIIDFGAGYGIEVYYNNTSWSQLDSRSPESMVTGDLDGSGQDELIVTLPGGLWVYYNNTTWTKLPTAENPNFMVTGDMDASGQDELIVDLGGTYGIWIYYNNAKPWSQLDTRTSESMVTGDMDAAQQ